MADGLNDTELNKILAAFFRTAGYVAYSGPAVRAIQLHTANPGPNGTTAVTNAGRRIAISAMSVPSAGITSNLALMKFVACTVTATITFATIWDSLTVGAGTFIDSCPMTGAMLSGQDFDINIGDFVYSGPLAS